jgi:DNA-binding beta-propeller fold protein YncE
MHRRTFLQLAALAAVAPARALALPATGRALAFATADDDASVVVLDLATGRVVARIATPAGPSSIETVGRGTLALVGHADAGAVSLIDVASLRVVRVLEGFGEPRYTAAGPGGRYAYVTDAARGELAVIDLVRRRVSDRVEAGALARHLTISPDGRSLFAALGPKAEAVAELDASDPARPRLKRSFAPVDRAHDVVVSVDGSTVWVTSGVADGIALHDARSTRLVRRIAAGRPPQHVALAGDRVYVANGADGTLQVHAPDGRLLRTTRIPLDSYNVTFGAGHVVTPSLMLGTVSTLTASGAFVRRERVTRAAHDACIATRRRRASG